MSIYCNCTNEQPTSVDYLLGVDHIVLDDGAIIAPHWLCATCFEAYWCDFYDLYTVDDTGDRALTANPSHFDQGNLQ